MSARLGIAKAVRDFGDNWLIADHLSLFVAEPVLLGYRVSVRLDVAGPDDADAGRMRDCMRRPELWQDYTR